MARSSPLPSGKVPGEILTRFLRGRAPGESEVVGPGVGLDGAVLDLGGHGDRRDGRFLVAASDPITFTADDIGWYAVHVNANDVACMGASPAWFLADVLLAEGTDEEEARKIFEQIDEACGEVGAALVGGHTEVAPGFERTVVVGTMLGVTDRWLAAAGARPGDALLLTKGIALEGTAILGRSAGEEIRGKVDDDVLARARRLLRDPGLSVVPDARTALAAGDVRALHDPTEGGLSGGVHELCEASGTGARIELDAVPVLDETRILAEALGFDPLGLIASGGLLVAAPEHEAATILDALRAAEIRAVRIGSLVEPEEGVVAVDAGGGAAPLERFESDELTRIL